MCSLFPSAACCVARVGVLGQRTSSTCTVPLECAEGAKRLLKARSQFHLRAPAKDASCARGVDGAAQLLTRFGWPVSGRQPVAQQSSRYVVEFVHVGFDTGSDVVGA